MVYACGDIVFPLFYLGLHSLGITAFGVLSSKLFSQYDPRGTSGGVFGSDIGAPTSQFLAYFWGSLVSSGDFRTL